MPNVLYPFVYLNEMKGGYWNDWIYGLLPVYPGYNLGLTEIKDRFGGPNYGSGPYLHAVIWPEGFTGDSELPPAFQDCDHINRDGGVSCYFLDGLQGSGFDSGYFYRFVRADYYWLSSPTRGYYFRAEGRMAFIQRDRDSGDLFLSYSRTTRSQPELFLEGNKRNNPPLPSRDLLTAAAFATPLNRDLFERVTQNGRIISRRVYNLSPIASIENAQDVLRYIQDFDTINTLDIYTSGNASDFQGAYVDACDQLLNSRINSIANILELANTIKGICELLKDPVKGIRDLLSTYKDPRDAWLAYRYSYSTTKADISEYKELIGRLKELSALVGQRITAHGREGSYRCAIVVDVADILPKTVYDFLSMVGIEPNAQNVWDMIPYSFVVDWFAGISDVMEWFDKWTYSITIEPTEIWFSNMVNVAGRYRVYYRVRGRKLEVPPRYVNKTSSGKTWLCRFGDAISLFTS